MAAVLLASGCDRYESRGQSPYLWRLNRWTGEVCLFQGWRNRLDYLGCYPGSEARPSAVSSAQPPSTGLMKEVRKYQVTGCGHEWEVEVAVDQDPAVELDHVKRTLAYGGADCGDVQIKRAE